MKAMTGVGRLAEGRSYENLDAHLKIRMKVSERAGVDECAARSRMRVSEWARRALMAAVVADAKGTEAV